MALPEYIQQGIERRVYPRKKLHLRADVTLPGDLTIESHTLDISANGAMVKVPYRLEEGAECTISFRCARSGALRGACVRGIVKHCTLNGEHFFAGLHFPDMPDSVQEALVSLL